MTSIAFYVVGYIIVASSQSIYSYGVGNSIYIIGITGTFRVLPNRDPSYSHDSSDDARSLLATGDYYR
jgi:hypothetical protein